MEQQTKSQPNNLYQFPGLVFGQPGITPDPSGYTHIRGSDFNQVGFDVDGVQITEPMTNSFATNIVTVGLKSANLITGGADASYGNASGGFINEVTNNGRDLRGGIIEGTFGPSHSWNYRGTNSQYGNVIGGTPRNPKFDYYFSTIQFANNFPGNTQIQKLGASFDGVGKFNYYADPNNTVTAFLSQGFEQYDNFDPYNPAHTFKYEVGPGDSVDKGSFQQDHDDQGYNFNYLGYKHNFDTKSFATYRLYQLKNYFNDHAENATGLFETRHATSTGNQLDYTNQISPQNQLKFGLAYIPSSTYFREIASPVAGSLQPFAVYGKNGDIDFLSQAKPDQSVLYLSDQIKAAEDKLTLTLGARYANMDYRLNQLPYQVMDGSGNMVDAKSFNKHYLDPRVGATYSLERNLLLRTSYAVESQFADSRLVERLYPEDNNVNVTPTSTNPAAQLAHLRGRYAQYNTLGPNHGNNFDLGLERGFDLSGLGAFSGGYSFDLTGFTRKQTDLIQYTRVSYNPLSGVRGYDTSGKGSSSGLEFKLGKNARNPYDLNGFVSYTNLVAKATNSDFDTGYIPYFYNAFAGQIGTVSNGDFITNNHTEFPTSYAQRHTIGVDVTKRYTKLLESSIILDAGSGFPFSNGLANIGATTDAQHTTFTSGTTGIFQEVPITLFNQHTLQPQNPTVGQSGWHYKISINTNFYLTPTTNLFFDVDNVFDKQTVLAYSTVDQAGAPYYAAPTAAYPQGRIYYGPSTIITPIFATFGFRTKF